MCSQVRCRSCGKPTWAGCGAHVEMALRNVPRDERCKCREQAAKSQPQQGSGGKKLFGLF